MVIEGQSASPWKSPSAVKTFRKPRAVVFDDDDSIRNVLRHYLLMRDYEVLSCDNPASVCVVNGKGRDFCGGEEACCDILITDINMPGANGIELLEQQTRKGCKLAVKNKLVISGSLEDGDMERAQMLGCSLLLKPFTLEALSRWLSACEQRFDLDQPLASRRHEERFEGAREIKLAIVATGDVQDGVIVNMSTSGLCLKIYTPLEKEQSIRVEGSHFPSTRQATVRWVFRIARGAFLTGVHCAPARSAPSAVTG